MALSLGWYFHLPPCATEREVDIAVRENLALLLDAHRDSGAAVGLAITGGLLARMEGRHHDRLAQLAGLARAGVVEVLATSHHEVCPFLIPPRYLRLQIATDLAIKARLLDVRPSAFWPGNHAWAPVLANILIDLGLRASIVGEPHLAEARQTQLWHWLRDDELKMGTVLSDTAMGAPPAARSYRLAAGADESLALLVQETTLRRALSFGTRGAIHHAWDDAPLDTLIAGLEASGSLSADSPRRFSGDDGDRINPVSIHQYRRLLARIGAQLQPPSALADVQAETLEFLPTHAPGGMAFWQDEVAFAYLQVLDELYRAVGRGRLDAAEVLPLQDVFPIFWKRIARARWFHDRAWALLQQIGS